MQIRIDDLAGQAIADFLEEHLEDMKSVSPPESKHALDLEGLKAPDVTFWSVWENDCLTGCIAIKELDKYHGELKSMRTRAPKRGAGIGAFMLAHVLAVSRSRGYRRVSLETGSMAFFEPARRLYRRFGFDDCEPFGNYKHDPNSVFMSLSL